jgi:hypothetical protein
VLLDLNAAPRDKSRRRPWFERAPINLGELAVETIAVVFGILLALWIDDWHQQRQQQATVEQALRAIRGEIATNQRSLREHMAKFKPSADHMLKAPENRNQPPRVCPGWVGWRGLNLPTLLDAAYQTAIATQALANMRFEEAQQVAKVYGAQRSLQHFYDLDGGMLLDHYPKTLEQCAGIILEISRSDAAVDAAYSQELQHGNPVVPPAAGKPHPGS